MKVRCLANTGVNFNGVYETVTGYGDDAVFRGLTVGREYSVFAIAFRERLQVWYYILDDYNDCYPSHYPESLFDVVDMRVSEKWYFKVFHEANAVHRAFLSFREWVEEPFFYDRLTDGKEREIEIFKMNSLENG